MSDLVNPLEVLDEKRRSSRKGWWGNWRIDHRLRKHFRKKYRQEHPWWWTRTFRFLKRYFFG